MKKIIFFIIATIIFVSGCKKKDPPPPSSTPPPTGGSSSLTLGMPTMLSATIDGSSVSFTENGTPYEGVVGASKNAIISPPTTTAVYEFGLYNNVAGIDVFDVSKGTLSYSGYSVADSTSFSAFFPKTSYNYSTNAVNGVEFAYWIGGTKWSTSFGTADQTGSSFTVTDKTAGMVFGSYYVWLKVTFNCKIYDGIGNSKTVTNGTMIIDFESI